MKPTANSIPGPRSKFWCFETAKHLAFLTLLSVFLTWGGRQVLPWDKMFPDFISFWSAGKILVMGESPYDVKLQTQIQQAYGWEKASDGFGIYEFLPNYYPPWFGYLWIAVLPIGFEAGKLAWFFINVELALLTAFLLRSTIRGISGWAPYTFVPFFLFTLAVVALGQSSIVVFFLTTLTWILFDRNWDRSAGVALAWLTIKPQLTTLVILGVLIWLVRQRRYQGVITFLLTSALLTGISSLQNPGWLSELLNAPRVTSPPTDYFPWIGNTWFLVLRSLGLEGRTLWTCYLFVAVDILGVLCLVAATKSSSLEKVMGLALIGAFFMAPYARHYDFVILLIPILLIMGYRPSALWSATLILLFLAIPYGQMFLLAHLKTTLNPDGKFMLECSYSWIPVATLAGWIFTTWNEPIKVS